MAMKKSELEFQREQYERLLSSARSAEQSGMYRASLEHAMSAWQYIDGMMQYERRYEKVDFNSIPAIDLVLKYAPLLFQHESLARLENLLADFKRIEKLTAADMGQRLNAARERLWLNHRLWSFLEENPGTRQDQLATQLGGDQDYWRSIAESWEKMGILSRSPVANSYCLTIVTRLGQVVSAKCPHCGTVVQAPKAMLLEESSCHQCSQMVSYVFMSDSPN